MEKIIVTEEQAQVIENVKTNWSHEDEFSHMKILKKFTGLDNYTIFRIVEGAEYEVKRDFKVGDIVFHEGSRNRNWAVVVVEDDGEYYSNCTEHEINITYIKKHSHEYILICKVEERHDLKGE